jgi:hypothetical protein
MTNRQLPALADAILAETSVRGNRPHEMPPWLLLNCAFVAEDKHAG